VLGNYDCQNLVGKFKQPLDEERIPDNFWSDQWIIVKTYIRYYAVDVEHANKMLRDVTFLKDNNILVSGLEVARLISIPFDAKWIVDPRPNSTVYSPSAKRYGCTFSKYKTDIGLEKEKPTTKPTTFQINLHQSSDDEDDFVKTTERKPLHVLSNTTNVQRTNVTNVQKKQTTKPTFKEQKITAPKVQKDRNDEMETMAMENVDSMQTMLRRFGKLTKDIGSHLTQLQV
jgi:hypothetical protein